MHTNFFEIITFLIREPLFYVTVTVVLGKEFHRPFLNVTVMENNSAWDFLLHCHSLRLAEPPSTICCPSQSTRVHNCEVFEFPECSWYVGSKLLEFTEFSCCWSLKLLECPGFSCCLNLKILEFPGLGKATVCCVT